MTNEKIRVAIAVYVTYDFQNHTKLALPVIERTWLTVFQIRNSIKLAPAPVNTYLPLFQVERSWTKVDD